MLFPTVVDAGAQAGVADELLWLGKTGDITNGSQHSYDYDEAEAWKLEQLGCMLSPGLCSAKAVNLLLDLCKLHFDVIDDAEIMANVHDLGGREVELMTLIPMFLGEDFSC